MSLNERNSQFEKSPQERIHEKLIDAVRTKNIEKMKFLLNNGADIHFKNDNAIGWARLGDIKTIKFLLTSPEIKEHANIHANKNELFTSAAYSGRFTLVKYLLTSPDLKEHSDIHADNDYALREAARNGHLKMVEFLLSSPDIKEYANIHANNDEALRNASRRGHLDIVKFLLFSKKLKDHANINTLSKNDCAKGIQEWLESYNISNKVIASSTQNKIKIL